MLNSLVMFAVASVTADPPTTGIHVTRVWSSDTAMIPSLFLYTAFPCADAMLGGLCGLRVPVPFVLPRQTGFKLPSRDDGLWSFQLLNCRPADSRPRPRKASRRYSRVLHAQSRRCRSRVRSRMQGQISAKGVASAGVRRVDVVCEDLAPAAPRELGKQLLRTEVCRLPRRMGARAGVPSSPVLVTSHVLQTCRDLIPRCNKFVVSTPGPQCPPSNARPSLQRRIAAHGAKRALNAPKNVRQ
jgi:hypothetical protein